MVQFVLAIVSAAISRSRPAQLRAPWTAGGRIGCSLSSTSLDHPVDIVLAPVVVISLRVFGNGGRRLHTRAVGFIDVANLRYVLGAGRVLFEDVSFRVADGSNTALIGANGTGKTTLLRIVAGDLAPTGGAISSRGGVGVMRQFIGSIRDRSTVRDLLVAVAPSAMRLARRALDEAERGLSESGSNEAAIAHGQAIADWSEVGGFDAELVWNLCTQAALHESYDDSCDRLVAELSGGEQKRLALEALLRGRQEVLLLDEPDNYLDVPGKQWLEEALRLTRKTVLFVTHDRELLGRTADRAITLEGGTAWTHGGSFGAYADARRARHERQAEVRRRWDEERERLTTYVRTLQQQAARSADMASRYRAAQTRLARYEAEGAPPDRPREQNVRIKLIGSQTGVRVLMCDRLELTDVMQPFDLELFFGERIAVLGANGTGKSHFLRLLGGDDIAFGGRWRLGARVVPGSFSQLHQRADLEGRVLVDVLHDHRLDRGQAIGALRRYELGAQADQSFATLSGGQQARLQILLLELGGATLLLLDEPTDNLDIDSAQALEDGLAGFEGTVIAVTHDRWFARSFDRFLVFGSDGVVRESGEPVWEPARRAQPAHQDAGRH
jgi:ATPase subunit of ABC transporter with duplicated ATPase domains